MKVTHVAIIPTEAAKEAGRPALTPELLAASGARYSRNNEGLDAILSKIEFGNREKVLASIEDWLMEYYKPCAEFRDRGDVYPIDGNELAIEAMDAIWNIGEIREAELEKGVDGIFKMVDYGHQSIADMAPVSMFMDGMSIYAAYLLWSLCATAGGQESSTRYIRMSMDGLIDPEELGIKYNVEAWRQGMQKSFDNYTEAVALWEELSVKCPSLMRIPESLLNDPSEKAQKQVARMRRNYAFDRARVFLPVAAATNVMMVQSARSWVQLSAHLLSHPLPEMQKLGELIRDELELVTPRLTKHARFTEATRQVLDDELADLQFEGYENLTMEADSIYSVSPDAYINIMRPRDVRSEKYVRSLKHRVNRYSLVGSDLSRVAVSFGWEAVALAEIRDLNRHRTGTKKTKLRPAGFYAAEDQVPVEEVGILSRLRELAAHGAAMNMRALALLGGGDWTYVYFTLLGTQYPFEHVTTADKFIYESELRTGLGAHYRYAKHLRDALQLFYQEFPNLKGLVIEGSAEPE